MIPIAKIVKTVGLKGQCKLYLYTDLSLITKGLSIFIDQKKYLITSVRIHKNQPVVTFSNINSIEEVEPFIGKEVLAKKDELSLNDDTYFVRDLIGFSAYCSDQCVGTLVDIYTEYVQDQYVFSIDGREIMIPGVKEFIKNIDYDKKRIEIVIPEGL